MMLIDVNAPLAHRVTEYSNSLALQEGMTMALKDLLVHVTGAPDSGPAIDAALALAEQHDAHLAGLAIRAPLDIPVYAEAHLPESMLQILQEREDQRIAGARQLFESKAKHAGRGDRIAWRVDSGLPFDTLGLHARYADLTVVAQDNPEKQDYRFAELAEDLLVASGRPVLVVPSIGARPTIGRTVIVAWNGSREAARALADAMPILEKARSVEIFIAGEPHIGDLPGADIAAHLARHQIRVEVYRLPGAEAPVGGALLNRTAAIGGDLIVMGGYGHSRLREFVLGGATRHILQHLTVPVLMSH
jgi:nucleotide-binding universal stress UspA family protein